LYLNEPRYFEDYGERLTHFILNPRTDRGHAGFVICIPHFHPGYGVLKVKQLIIKKKSDVPLHRLPEVGSPVQEE